MTKTAVIVADRSDAEAFDVVLVELRRDQLSSAWPDLARLCGNPLVVLFVNNPNGRVDLPDLSREVFLGFPGVGGTITDGVAHYVTIAQQATAVERGNDPRLDELCGALHDRGFDVQRVAEMSGWLVYHAVFVASICAALDRCETDPQRLARDRTVLTLMCQAITQGFRRLHHQGVEGLPRNLALLHARGMQPVAVRYWAHSMRSPMGELVFAAHARHARDEMRAIARDVLLGAGNNASSPALSRLLRTYAEARSGTPVASLDRHSQSFRVRGMALFHRMPVNGLRTLTISADTGVVFRPRSVTRRLTVPHDVVHCEGSVMMATAIICPPWINTFLVVRDQRTTVLVGVWTLRRRSLRRAFAQAGIPPGDRLWLYRPRSAVVKHGALGRPSPLRPHTWPSGPGCSSGDAVPGTVYVDEVLPRRRPPVADHQRLDI